MISINIDPVLISFFGFEIRYYGLVYVLGFLLGLYTLNKARKDGILNLEKDQVYDLMFYLMLGVIIGARLFHAIFWDFSYFLKEPWKILYLWQGGMSFHGGLFGILLSGYIYCKKKNINAKKLADVLTLPAVFALALGRIVNFINQEIVGTVTNVSWCFKFKNYEECRHPVQLYAAFGRFLAFFILLKFWNKHKEGFIFWNFILFFGIGRFFLDFIREDLIYLGLKAGQWFSLIMIIVSGYILFKFYMEDVKKVFSFKKDNAKKNQENT